MVTGSWRKTRSVRGLTSGLQPEQKWKGHDTTLVLWPFAVFH